MTLSVELVRRGYTGVHSDWSREGWVGLARGALAAMAWENVAEYVWHRVMHTRFFYARLHKLHHHYKAPTPFDDLFVHPYEITGYYCILYAPVVLFRLHWASLAVYAAVMGLAGARAPDRP
jgi:Delta7-sterol 5-desaturase